MLLKKGKMDLPMHDNFKSDEDSEIDLIQLLIVLWNYKIFLVSACLFGIFLGGYFALTTDKKYTSTATFKLTTDNNRGLDISSELNILSSFSGFNLPTTAELPYDEVMGREFIIKLDKKVNFRDDKFYYDYNPDLKDPIWKATIKNLIGWENNIHDVDERMWQEITKKYKNTVLIKLTKDNSLKLLVTHKNADRAAEITNAIMLTTLENKRIVLKNSQDKLITHLAETLAKALTDLEESQLKLKNFTLEYSAQPIENFAAKTLILDTHRENLIRTSDVHNALSNLLLLIEKDSLTHSDYLSLRKTFPIVDQVEFRRFLGQNESISSWTWPNKTTVRTVFETLSERLKRLEAKVIEAQLEASNAGNVLNEYVPIKREAEISEATYTVLIEQLKAQSIAAGYRPDTSRIFEYAAPPLDPSSPNRNLLLVLGAALGFFLGSILALLIAKFRDVFYSQSALISVAQSRLNIYARPLLPLQQKPLQKLNQSITNRSRAILRDLAVEIHRSKSTQIIFTSINSKLSGNDIAKAIATYMHSGDLKIALINFNLNHQDSISNETKDTIGSFNVIENLATISILQPNTKLGSIEFLARRDFQDQIQALNSNFDLIFLSAEDSNALSLVSTLANCDLPHFTVARIKRTKTKAFKELCSQNPIKGLIYE